MAENNTSRKNSFPKILFIFLVPAAGLFGILYVSIEYIPVNKDNSFMQQYSYIDKNYNEFHQAQQDFKEFYNLQFNFNEYSEEKIENLRANIYKEYFTHGFILGKNNFSFSVINKEGQPIKADNITILLTRYDTNKFDKDLENYTFQDSSYKVDNLEIDKPGRWKVIVKAEIDGKFGFFEQGIFAK